MVAAAEFGPVDDPVVVDVVRSAVLAVFVLAVASLVGVVVGPGLALWADPAVLVAAVAGPMHSYS